MKEIIFPDLPEGSTLHPYPMIRKNGIVSSCSGEMSLFVRNRQLLCLENDWADYYSDGDRKPFARIFDYGYAE